MAQINIKIDEELEIANEISNLPNLKSIQSRTQIIAN